MIALQYFLILMIETNDLFTYLTGQNMKRQIKQILNKSPKLSAFYRTIKENLHDDLPIETPMGFKLAGNPLMQKGNFEPDETEIVKRILPNVDVMINIGANIGYYCCMALQNKKYVVAFEPIAENLKFLLRNIKANNWQNNIEIFPLALSNTPGILEMYGGGTGASLVKGWADTPEHYVNLVPCSTLDKVLGKRFEKQKCFILVDIEGAEKMMLEGASSILAREPKPIWMVEITTSEHQPKGIKMNPHLESTFQNFWDAGYEAYTAAKELRPVYPDEIKKIVETGFDTLQVHNFLFIEKNKKDELLNTH